MVEHCKNEHYSVVYDDKSNSIQFKGLMDDHGKKSCDEMMAIVETAAEKAGFTINWDIRELKVLSSTAMGRLYRYLVKQQGNKTFKLKVSGSEQCSWQQKFLPNVKKILPQARLHFS